MTKISFIGAGKMAEALIARLPQSVLASDLDPKRLVFLKKKYRINVAQNNLEAFAAGEIVVLAIKPQHMAVVLDELSGAAKQSLPLQHRRQKLIISIAAGIPLNYLQKNLPGLPVIRAMPNNPALIGLGVTALAKGKLVDQSLFKKAEQIFAVLGEVVVLPEKMIDAVTGLSGSGPAFVYQMIEAMIAGGVAAGLPASIAQKLAVQTCLGAAMTVKVTGKSPAELCQMVASPGGTTIEGLKVLAKRHFPQTVAAAIIAAAKKSKIISEKWTS